MMPGSLTDRYLNRLAHSVLWPGFHGTDAPDWLMRALEGGLAGAVYFAQNLQPPVLQSSAALSKRLHEANELALIGVDEEGGVVTRLEATTGSSTPGNAVLGRVDDIEVTQRTAAWIGSLVAAAGIDVNLAPTVDVNSNPLNPVIGVRSFSSDPAVVARHAAAYVRGVQQAGVAACPKHFPGHGDTTTDSHLAVAVADISLTELYDVHLPPFRAAIEAGAKALMSAHIRVPALGEDPATINGSSLAMARDLGFEGVLITDAVDMAAIRGTIGSGAGAVAALQAGADLVCIGNPSATVHADGRRRDEMEFREVLHAVYDALASGALDVDRVDQAAQRISDLAAWRRRQPQHAPDLEPFDGSALAARAAVVTGDVRLSGTSAVTIDARAPRSIAVGDAADFFTVALRDFMPTDRVALAGLSEADAVGRVRAVLASRPEQAVLLVGQPQSSAFEATVLAAALEAQPDTIVVYAGWPAESAMAAKRAIVTYGASRATAQHAARLLAGRT